MGPRYAGLTVGEALADVRAAAVRTSAGAPRGARVGVPPLARRALARRAASARQAWHRVTGWKAIAVGVVVTPLVLAAVMVGADALGLHGGPRPTASTPAGGRGAPAARHWAAPVPHRRAVGDTTATTPTTQPHPAPRPGPTTSATAARSVASPASRPRPAAAAAGRGAATASGHASGGSSATTTSVPASAPTSTSVPATTTTTAPAPSPLAAWRTQNGSVLTTLQDDVAAVQAASPSPSGDYTALVAPWQQLAADVATAQSLPAIPDAATETTWSAALDELATATADWLASLSSTSPPGGTIANQTTFAAGTAQFTQGVTDLGTVEAAVAAA